MCPIIYVTKADDSGSNAGDRPAVHAYQGYGVWVPPGQSAVLMLEGAWVLEDKFDVAPYLSRQMVSAVLARFRELGIQLDPCGRPE